MSLPSPKRLFSCFNELLYTAKKTFYQSLIPVYFNSQLKHRSASLLSIPVSCPPPSPMLASLPPVPPSSSSFLYDYDPVATGCDAPPPRQTCLSPPYPSRPLAIHKSDRHKTSPLSVSRAIYQSSRILYLLDLYKILDHFPLFLDFWRDAMRTSPLWDIK